MQTNSALTQKLNDVHTMLKRRIKGCDEQLWLVTWCVFLGRHIHLLGVPGTGKTLLVKTLMSIIVGASFRRIQCVPDMLPGDITGAPIFNEGTREFEFKRGPIFANLILADEINRTPPRTQAGLLEAMGEKQVSAAIPGSEANTTLPLPSPFFVAATGNPIEQEGTYPLPEAQLDRFSAQALMPQLQRAELMQVIAGCGLAEVEPVVNIEEMPEIAAAIEAVTYSDEILGLIADIVLATMIPDVTLYAVSPRAGLAILALAKASAFTAGRNYVLPSDVHRVALPCLRHRLSLTAAEQSRDDGTSAVRIVTEILEGLQTEASGA